MNPFDQVQPTVCLIQCSFTRKRTVREINMYQKKPNWRISILTLLGTSIDELEDV